MINIPIDTQDNGTISAASIRAGKIFGVALDASDDPLSLQLKWAAMMAGCSGANGFDIDPYAAAAESLSTRHHFQLAGRFQLPSWLGPRPLPADRSRVKPENYQRFYDDKGFLKISDRICEFVQQEIFPEMPVMIGIDHSASGGVVAALSQRYGAENLSVIVLDRHFDGISLSQRVDAGLTPDADGVPFSSDAMPFSGMDGEEYCCGSFWAHLLDSSLLFPENLAFIGVADYPRQEPAKAWRRFQESYLAFEQRGCRFFPLWEFEQPYLERLTQFIKASITTPYLYVSLDVDVGSLNCVHAARYMDGPGISRENLLDIAAAIAGRLQGGSTSLVGLDLMEFNMHFLGIEIDEGMKDQTLEVVSEFIGALLPITDVNGNVSEDPGVLNA